jgi:large subunit ribosomal protein L7Ae
LKVPPALNQFTRTLDKNQAAELFKLLVKYKPETKAAKEERIEAKSKAVASGDASAASGSVVPVLKYGLRHITTLVEQKKAKLVVIAHDVDPIELVVWLPALCRKMQVPYCIVKGKARLGTLTNKKTSAVVALTSVNKEDEGKLKSLAENFMTQYNNHVERTWGGGIMGLKTQARLEKRKIAVEIEEAKKREARAR